jgi:hypothetical protein
VRFLFLDGATIVSLMKPIRSILAAVLLAAVACPVAADTASPVAGDWRVVGKVASFGFTLNCRFKALGGGSLGGTCQDVSTSDPKVGAGKVHTLSAGAVSGDHVAWTYGSSFLLSKFDVSYDGVRTGDRMTGAISVQGRKGAFTATRR